MRLNYMTPLVCACGLLLGLNSIHAHSKISSQDIMSVVDDIATASEERNIRDLMFHLSPDIVIVMRDGNQMREFDYTKYMNYIGRIFPLVSRYDYIRNNEKIDYDRIDDNRAQLTFRLTEKYVVNGNKFSEQHREEWMLRKVNGSLEVYKIVIN